MGFLKRIIRTVLSIGLVAVAAMFLSATSTATQKQERTIKQRSWRNEPVKIVAVKVKGKTIKLGEQFTEDDDWLQGLTLRIRNDSGKKITYVSLSLDFEPPGKNSPENPVVSQDLEYGRNPSWPVDAVIPNPPKLILPKESIDMTLSEMEHESLKRLLSESGFPSSLKQMSVVLDSVVFDDGTMWSGGGIFRRDPNDPGVWHRVKEVGGGVAHSTRSRIEND